MDTNPGLTSKEAISHRLSAFSQEAYALMLMAISLTARGLFAHTPNMENLCLNSLSKTL